METGNFFESVFDSKFNMEDVTTESTYAFSKIDVPEGRKDEGTLTDTEIVAHWSGNAKPSPGIVNNI